MKTYILISVTLIILAGCMSEKSFKEKERTEQSSDFESKNLLRGSSFELDHDNYDAINRLNWGNAAEPEKKPYITNKEAHHGTFSLCFPAFSQRHTNSLSFFPVKIKSNGKHTFSFWAKAKKKNTKIRIQSIDINFYQNGVDGKKVFSCHSFLASPEWKRYSYEFNGNSLLSPVFQVRRTGNDGPVYIDAVQIEKGKITDYAPSSMAEISIQMKNNGNIYLLGDKPVANITLIDNRISGAKTMYKLKWELKNHLGKVLKKDVQEISLKPGQRKSFKAILSAHLRGHFSLTGDLFWGNKKLERENQFYAVFKENDYDITKSPFAMHNYFQNNTICQTTSERSNLFGAGWARQHYWFTWDRIEKTKGKYSFNDILVNDLKKKNIKILATLGAWFSCKKGPGGPFRNVSTWAETNDIQTQYGPYDKSQKGKMPCNTRYSMIPNLEMFSKYIYETVNHYKYYVKHWEIMNEPYIRSDAAAYGKILKAAYIAAKKADSDSIVLAQVSPDPKYLEELIVLGYGRYFDGVTTHYMGVTRENEVAHLIQFRKLMKKAGKAKDAIFWVSEGTRIIRSSYPFDDLYSQQHSPIDAAANHVHHLVHCLAGGASRKFFFCSPYNNGGRGRLHIQNFSFTEFDNTPRLVLMALSAAGELLADTSFLKSCKPLDPKLKINAYIFKRKNEELAVLWNNPLLIKQYSASIDKNAKIKVYDFMGNKKNNSKGLISIPKTAIYMTGNNLDNVIKNMKFVKAQKESNLNIVIEAEHAKIVKPMKIMPEGALINDNDLMWVEGPIGDAAKKHKLEETGWIDFNIDIPEKRHYKVALHVYFPGAGSDSFYVSLDGKGKQSFGSAKHGQWLWITKTFLLSKGKHVIRIWPREERSRIDKIIVY